MNQIIKRNTGAAHIGFSMFGARGPLLAPEGDGTGSSIGSSTATVAVGAETATTALGATSVPATAPGGASEKMLPQSQVNTLVASAKREAYEKAQRDLREQQAAPRETAKAEPKTEADRLQQLEAKLEESEMRRGFDKRAARLGVSDDAAEDLFELYKVQRPQNADEWMEAKASRFGLKANTPAATAATTATVATVTSNPAPAAAPAAPSAHALPTANGVVDLFNLNAAQLGALGPQGVRENLEKLWLQGNQMSGAPSRPKPPSQR